MGKYHLSSKKKNITHTNQASKEIIILQRTFGELLNKNSYKITMNYLLNFGPNWRQWLCRSKRRKHTKKNLTNMEA
jgi:hypothetical protein